MLVTLESGDFGWDYILRAEDGRDVLVQVDYELPTIAANLGFVACECGKTDGTITCEHKTATEMISEAREFLDEHVGDSFEDPGYFEGEE